jgi:starch synthase
VRLVYVVLSPTFGMHQYTADLANHQAGAYGGPADDVTVITPRQAPFDRYAPQVNIQSPVQIAGTGLKRSNFSAAGLRQVYRTIRSAQPDIVHFTGPHIWNPILLAMLRRAGVSTLHTIHDLDPHSGAGYGQLLHLWNGLILRWAQRIVVHGQVYRDRLLKQGMPADRLVYIPLLHLCLSYQSEADLRRSMPERKYEPFALFFARLEAYKGVDVLLAAMRQHSTGRAIIAGKRGDDYALPTDMPNNVELRLRQIDDAEAIDLFSRCSVVVLPYRDATQSAVVATAYFFGKPVIVTRTGALPEYVIDNETGWVIEPENVPQLVGALRQATSDAAQAARVGNAGRAWYQTQFQQERLQLKSLYEELIYGDQRARSASERVGESRHVG